MGKTAPPPGANSRIGVALWLCPKKNSPLHDKLQVAMASLSTVFPGQPPSFEPHITITSKVAVDRATAKDDVDRILSACCVALDSLPRHENEPWVKLGRVASQRHFFKKLYFQVLPHPNLVSFARIVRELFVILPEKTAAEVARKNPPADHKRAPKPVPLEPHELDKVQTDAAREAAHWAVADYDPHLSLVYSNLHPIDSALWHTIRSRVSDYMSLENCDSAQWDDGNGFSWDGGVLKLVLCEGDVNDWEVLGSVDTSSSRTSQSRRD